MLNKTVLNDKGITCFKNLSEDNKRETALVCININGIAKDKIFTAGIAGRNWGRKTFIIGGKISR